MDPGRTDLMHWIVPILGILLIYYSNYNAFSTPIPPPDVKFEGSNYPNMSETPSPLCETNRALSYTHSLFKLCSSKNARVRQFINNEKALLDIKTMRNIENIHELCCFGAKKECDWIPNVGSNWDPSSGGVPIWRFNCSQEEYEEYVNLAAEWTISNGVFKNRQDNTKVNRELAQEPKQQHRELYKKVYRLHPELLLDAILDNRLVRPESESEDDQVVS